MDLDPSRFDQDEHEKYFFGYSSTEVYDGFKVSIIKCITSFLEECRNTLEEDIEMDKKLIELQIEDLRTVYVSACLEELSKFKAVLQHIFLIPPNAPIYKKDRGLNYTEEQVKCLRKEVEELEQEYFREKKFLEILKLEKQTIDKLKPVFLETKIRLINLRSDATTKRNETLQKLIKRHETCLNSLVLDTMKIEDSCEVQIDFQ